jgi:hypothetical protein
MLAAVDVIRPAREGRIGHDVDGQRGDVDGRDHAADREREAELIAAALERIAKRRRPGGCGSRWVEAAVVAVVMIPPQLERLAIWASIVMTGRGVSAICVRSACNAAL